MTSDHNTMCVTGTCVQPGTQDFPLTKTLQLNKSSASIASNDSGIGLDSSQDSEQLHHHLDHITSTSNSCTSFAGRGGSQSCPVSPRHSVTDPPLATDMPTSPPRSASAKSFQAKYPQTERHRRTLASGAYDDSTQVKRLPPISESSPSLSHKFESLNKQFGHTVRELSRSLTSLNGGKETPEGTPKASSRRMSDSAAIRRSSKGYKLTKGHSEGDINIIQDKRPTLCSRCSRSFDSSNEEAVHDDGTGDSGAATAAATADDLVCVAQELTRNELIWVADEVHPDKGCMLSTILHERTHIWDGLCLSHPNMPSDERLLRVLEKWFDDLTPSPHNRQTLVNACKRIKQQRVAYCVAKMVYANKT